MKRPRAMAGKATGKLRRKGAGAKRSSAAARPRAPRTAELQRQLAEALAQQAATVEVLQIINSSAGDLEPVFNAMLKNAVHICEASFGNLLLYDGNVFRHVALHKDRKSVV